MSRAYEPVSLGAACETKFQISRKLYREFYKGKSELGFRIDMKPPAWGQRKYKMRLFDWQDTPFDTLCLFLERDFTGIFELEDLVFRDQGVMHKTFDVNYSHLFEAFDAGWAEEIVGKAYPGARAKFDRQIQAFRDLLASPGPYFYIFCAADPQRGFQHNLFPMPTPAQVERLLPLLGARSPEHEFHLLVLGPAHDPKDYAHLGDKVTTGVRPPTSDKAKMLAWEGDDAGWDALLDPYQFVLHDQPGAAAAPVAVESAPEPPPAPRRKLFWR